jgi:hypothetical protein
MNRIDTGGMLDFDGVYLAIRYIPENKVDLTISLETSVPFEVMRRHFLIEETEGPVILAEPVLEPALLGSCVIHDVAVNRA